MNLYPQYLKETLNLETIEHKGGFVSFFLAPPICHIEEAYIAPEFRRTRLGEALFAEVRERATAAGCSELRTQVLIHRIGSERALRWNFALGFRMISAEGGRIMLSRPLSGAPVKED